MTTIIEQIIKEIFSLTPPIDLRILKKIFDSHPKFEEETPPVNLEDQKQQLIILKKLTDHGCLFNDRIDKLNIQADNFIANNGKQKSLREERDKSKEAIEHRENDLLASYTGLLPQIKATLAKTNPHAAFYSANADTDKQKAIIEEYSVALTRNLRELDIPAAKIELLNLKKTITDAIARLSNLEFICSARDTTEQLRERSAALAADLKTFTRLQPVFNDLHLLFIRQISTSDVSKAIKRIEKESADIFAQLEQIKLKISSIDKECLPEEVQARLKSEFLSAANGEQLIKSYENKIDNTLSSIYHFVASIDPWGLSLNPFRASAPKAAPTPHEVEQKKLTLSVEFLKLLAETRSLEEQDKRLQKHKVALGAIPTATEEQETITNGLIQQAVQAINALPSLQAPVVLGSLPKPTDYFLLIVENIPFVAKQIDQITGALLVLKELITAIETLERHRTTYELSVSDDSAISGLQELEQAVATIKSKPEIREGLIQQQKLCKQFLADIDSLAVLVKAHARIVFDLKVVNAELSKPIVPHKENGESLYVQLRVLQEDIEQKRIQILKRAALINPTSTEGSPIDEQVDHDSDPYAIDVSAKEIGSPLLQHPSDTTLSSLGSAFLSDSQKGNAPSVSQSQGSISNGVSVGEPVEPVAIQPLTKLDSSPLSKIGASLSTDAQRSPGDLIAGIGSDKRSTLAVGIDINGGASPILHSKVNDEPVSGIPTDAGNPIVSTLTSPHVASPAGKDDDAPLAATPTEKDDDALLAASPTEKDDDATLAASSTEKDDDAPIGTSPTEKDDDALLAASPTAKDDDAPIAASPTAKDDDAPFAASPIEKDDDAPLVTSPTGNADDASLAASPTQYDGDNEAPYAAPQNTNIAPTTELDREIDILNQRHQLNINALAQYPADIQEWYLHTYNAWEGVAKESAHTYKFSHLIKDILFELKQNNNLNTLHAYMRLCPDPTKDISALLALKPNVPTVDKPFNEETDLKACPTELRPLYAQYIKLRKDYPAEAELLWQALQILHQEKLLKDSAVLGKTTVLAQDIPSLTQDPRYEPLKRHRGFLKVWEMIEDLCRYIIGKISGAAEYEYMKRPCFFSTNSSKLLAEADILVKEGLESTTPEPAA